MIAELSRNTGTPEGIQRVMTSRLEGERGNIVSVSGKCARTRVEVGKSAETQVSSDTQSWTLMGLYP